MMKSIVNVAEDGDTWRHTPYWIRYFIALGLEWVPNSATQRLCFVSTPCDSQAAGLICLGSLLRRVAEIGTDDRSEHLKSLRKVAMLRHGSSRFRHRSRRGLYEAVLDGSDRIRFQRIGKTAPEQHYLLDANACEWAVAGDPHIEVRGLCDAIPFEPLYHALLPEGQEVMKQNLLRSDSVVVLCGRSTGSSTTEESFARLTFKCGEMTASLSALLCVHEWTGSKISRIRYLNSRKGAEAYIKSESYGRSALAPQLIVADGPAAFIAARKFAPSSDIITIVDRTSDLSLLELLGASVNGLKQWFDIASSINISIEAPMGVVLRTLTQRN